MSSEPATGELVLTIEGSPVTGSVVAPKVRIGSGEHDTDYGPNRYRVPAGTHRVEIFASWLSATAQASTTIEVPADGAVELFYSAPTFPGGPTRLGPTAHSRRGAKALSVVMVLVLAVMAFVLAGILIWG